LPQICARITYHGDEDFWARNMDECQRIFDAKEDAMLRTTRPFLYVGTFVVGFWLVRSLVREHAATLLRSRSRPDREMVETYRAFHTIARQVGKAMNQR